VRGKASSANSVAVIKAKIRAIARAERALIRRLEDIDFQNGELKDMLDNVDALAAAGQLPEVKLTATGSVLEKLLPAAKK
jgi:soluble cytochrome b562